MATPTPAAMRAAKKLFPMTKSGQSDKSIAAFHSAKALEIDAATGLPELIATLEQIAPKIGNMLSRLRFSTPQDAEILESIRQALTLSGNDAGNSKHQPAGDSPA